MKNCKRGMLKSRPFRTPYTCVMGSSAEVGQNTYIHLQSYRLQHQSTDDTVTCDMKRNKTKNYSCSGPSRSSARFSENWWIQTPEAVEIPKERKYMTVMQVMIYGLYTEGMTDLTVWHRSIVQVTSQVICNFLQRIDSVEWNERLADWHNKKLVIKI